MIINPDNHFYNMFYYFFLLCSNKLKYEIYINELIDYQKLYFKIDKSLLKCKKSINFWYQWSRWFLSCKIFTIKEI